MMVAHGTLDYTVYPVNSRQVVASYAENLDYIVIGKGGGKERVSGEMEEERGQKRGKNEGREEGGRKDMYYFTLNLFFRSPQKDLRSRDGLSPPM